MANSLAQDTDLDLLSVAVGGSTVEITPTITSGVKIADYVVDAVSGSLYTPKQSSYSAGTGIDITDNTISVVGDITPYSGGTGTTVTNHTINVTGDITPYSADTGISISSHKISVTGDITPYSGTSTINVNNHKISVNGDVTPYSAGVGIDINNHTISATGDITPYSAGNGISITNHNIAATGDITPYSGGTGVTVSSHKINVTGDITPYTQGTGISISNHKISVTGDITPYSGSDYIDITNHTVSVATPRKLVVDSTLYKTVNTATNEVHLGGNYVAGSGIDIVGNTISATGDITPYSAGSGIDITNHKISITGDVGGSLFEAVYGQTTYSDITAAIADKKIVYCRIAPTGTSRMAFLAYIGNSNVEFQYYRSLSQHTSANQGDEVYVYTCSSNNNWTTTTRKTYTKIAAGSGLGVGYSNETLTISAKALSAGKNITITDNVIDCNDAKSNFVYGNNTVNISSTNSYTGNFIACQGNSAIAPYFYGNTIFGSDNKMSGGISYSFLAGQYNEILGNNYNNTIFGASNKISGDTAGYTTIVGTNNSAIDKTYYSFIAGTYNILSGNYQNLGVSVLGYENNVKTFGSYRGSLIAGNSNNVSSNSGSDTSIILGQQNSISGDQIYNMGYYNNISGKHVHNFGERNSASNVEYSMNIGFQLNNTSTSSIQIGFSTAYYIEITPSGIYKILNGVRTSL